MAKEKRPQAARRAALKALLAASAALAASCGTQAERPYDEARMKMQQVSQQLEAGTIVVGKTRVTGVPMATGADGQVWLPIEHAARALNMQVRELRDGYAIGDTDAAYRLRLGDRNAMSGGRVVQLPSAPQSIGGKSSVSAESLTALLETPVRWNAQSRELRFTPIQDSAKSSTQRGISMQMSETSRPQTIGGRYGTLSAADADKLLSLARRFLGTPYDFGSGTYESTKRFDCSSFTQYVFEKVGVSLPRTSREQGQLGRSVSESDLQPGDLLFFYTPGRFDSNKVVGHVSIFAGNGKMIHTYGDPGVVIDEFNDYWKGRFLFAKRVL
ncbi:NlpC/P60 family protein [Paenibacillus pasadenensis]|uniref:C40 family peptidase n=1 Tax=Paenibacillus pasadenensis TaxID=217090 RepID=UPI000429352E|nr:C40 family peptidase [Paenibacillus pasadenensis]